MLKLEQYPSTISQTQQLILEFDKQIRNAAETLAILDNEIDLTIANDSSLKNDGQRKAERDRLRQTTARAKALKILNDLSDRRSRLEIDLEYYRNEYRLQILLLRQEVARLESVA